MASIRNRRNKYYARVVWRVSGKLKEVQIPLKTSSLTEARTRIKAVNNKEKDIASGIIQKYEFESLFSWLNPEGISKYKSLALVDIIPEYLKYRECVVSKGSVERDECSIQQLTRCLGENKLVQELNYKDIEQKFIPYYKKKGYENGGINISLRTLKIFFNYLHREKLISEKIGFKMLKVDNQPFYISRAEIDALHSMVDERMGRWFYFYEMVGCRARDPFKGFLDGNIWKIPPEEAKTRHWHNYPLTDELKYIWIEMQDLRQSYEDEGKTRRDAIDTCYSLLQKNMWRAINKLKWSGVVPKNKKLTLKSFRHTFGIINVVKTKDIWGTSKKMNHKEIGVTQEYLDINYHIIAQDFPELKPYLVDNNSDLQGEGTPKQAESSSPLTPPDFVDDGHKLMDTGVYIKASS